MATRASVHVLSRGLADVVAVPRGRDYLSREVSDHDTRAERDQQDVEWMARVRNGDHAAFRHLVERYQHPLTNYVYRTVLSRSEADDLTQDVFLKVYRAARTYRPTAKFSTWLYRIATNTCLNHLKAVGRIRTEPLEQERLTTRSNADQHKGFERKELGVAVEDALRQLPDRQRMAVTLRRFEELSYEEIAEAMNCSVSAVDSLLRRAADILRTALAPYRRLR